MISLSHIDHLVLTVNDLEATCAFYVAVLGMDVVTFAGGRKALQFGRQKFNLHEAGREFLPKARQSVPGSLDICLITETPLDDVVTVLTARGIAIEEGPVQRTGATGSIRSVYFRDPDGNLLELSNILARN